MRHSSPSPRRLRAWFIRSLAVLILLGACSLGNTPPQLQFIPDQNVLVSEGLRLTLGATDVDGDKLTFHVLGLPGGAQIIQQGDAQALLYWNPSITDTGPGGRGYEATVICDDDHGGQSAFSFNVWVFSQEGLPTFDISGGYVLNLAHDDDVALKVVVKDDDSTTLKITMLEGPSGSKLDPAGKKSRYFYWKPNNEQAKTVVHRAIFSAVDEQHAPVLHTLTIVLINTNQGSGCESTPPSVLYEHPGDQNLVGTSVPFVVQVTDYESTVKDVSVFWSLGVQQGEFAKLALTKSDVVNSTWSGSLDLPSLTFPGQLIHYFFVATDNDDHLGAGCDLQSRLPKKGFYTRGVYHTNVSPVTCIDDAMEEDDTLDTAAYLPRGAHYGMRLCGAESDWFELWPENDQALTVAVSRSVNAGPVALRLFDWSGALLAEDTSSNAVLRVESDELEGFAIAFAQVQSLSAGSRISYSTRVGVDAGNCVDDGLEPNSTANEASPLGVQVLEDLVLCPGDSDYFKITAQAGSQLRIATAFESDVGDLDLELLDGTGQTLLAYSTGFADSEEVVYNATEASTLFVRVFGYEGQGNTYTLGVSKTDQANHCEDDTLAPNQDAMDAVSLFMGSYGGLKLCAGTDDWFKVQLNGGETLQVSLMAEFAFGSKVEIFTDPALPAVATGTMANNGTASAELKAVPSEPLFVRVSGAGQYLTYTYEQEAYDPPGPCQEDRFEPNNFTNLATEVGTGGIFQWLRLCAGDKDLFALSVPPYSTLTVITKRSFGQGYADIVVVDPNGNPIAKKEDFGTGAQVATVVESAGVYLIEVSDPTGQATSLPYDVGIFID